MKILDVEPIVVAVNHRGDWIFVHVQTDQGLVGLGEASHSSNDRLVVAALHEMSRLLQGADPRQIEAIRARLSRKDGGRVWNTALSAVEHALWDILGQSLGAPIHALLGGAQSTRLRLYANINRHVQDRAPAGFARAAAQAVDEGYTAIKLAPFDELTGAVRTRTGPRAQWRPGVARVRAVRDAVGPEVEIAVDCHSRMELSEARMVGQALADLDLFWYEEPVAHTQVADLAALTATLPMPIASAESIFSVEGFRPFLTDHVVDVIMPDVKHCGGILALKEIAAAARMHAILVAPHDPSGPVATAATAQVAATIANFYILEHAWGEVPWRAELLDPPERIEDGHLLLPTGPGLGHRLHPARLAEHRRATS